MRITLPNLPLILRRIKIALRLRNQPILTNLPHFKPADTNPLPLSTWPGVRSDEPPVKDRAFTFHHEIVQQLMRRVTIEGSVEVLGVLAMTLGRVGYDSAFSVERAESTIQTLIERTQAKPSALLNAMRGLESLEVKW